MAKASKASVNYRQARLLARKRCGSCSMFRRHAGATSGTCTLVAGAIGAADVCDRWEGKPAKNS